MTERVAEDRLVVMQGNWRADRVTTHRAEGTTGQNGVVDVATGELVYTSVVFDVPGDFVERWRAGR